ncbi:ammonium transporter [Marssonina coronariae]|uniref:Ammonium transporter n=1 Tax=Diplocarpon coronariae TaxID=2795749 RepID=A0A218YZ09_9HELO|nr:ammonium transporter [Marssonina coronariae]
MASTALVFMMVPGIALFYSGLRSQTTALSLIWISMMAVAVNSIQWFLFGFSLVFSDTPTNSFIGNFKYALFLNMDPEVSFAGVRAHDVPAMVFGLFQGMFSAFTIALVTGVIAEKGRLLPFLVFSFFWSALVYNPIAYWLWNEQGWSNQMGGLDWAGGTPVHISSGSATLAYTIMLKHIRVSTDDTHSINSVSYDKGRWKRYLFSRSLRKTRLPSGPSALEAGLESHNMTSALLGLLLVWFGWFGFNAGSELKANIRAAASFISTNVAACSGGVTYTLLERLVGQKWSGLGFCTGVFSGLVAITPGAGYVPPWAALIFGSTAAAVCFALEAIKSVEEFLEEPLHITIIHGACGLWGMFLTGIFAEIQMAGGFAGAAYSFLASLALLGIIEYLSIYFPFLELRARSRKGTLPNLDDLELEDTGAYRLTCRYHPVSNQPPARQSFVSARPSTSQSQCYLQDPSHSSLQYLEMDGYSPPHYSTHTLSTSPTRTDHSGQAKIGLHAFESGAMRGCPSR